MALLYPNKCIFCGEVITTGKLICATCLAKEVMIEGRICGFCGAGTDLCNCAHHRNHYIRNIACAYYKDSVRRGISRFKFYRYTMLAPYYGRLMAENIKSKYQGIAFDGIIPVPMHRLDYLIRGYNCTELLSNEISKEIACPVITDVLYKRSYGRAQKRAGDRAKRAANILDAFGVRHAESIRGKALLLVDDISTTGATLNECAKMLRLYGAACVYAATFALVARYDGKKS